MTLVLELLDGGDRRLVQPGRVFSLGSFPGATWSLPQTQGAAPAGEVRITPEAASATVTLLRGAASLDQRALTADPRPLPPDGILQIGPHRIRAQFRSDLSTSHASSAPTISSILSDVTPGGASAEGLVQARSGDEDWIDALAKTTPKSRPDWDTLGGYTGRDEAATATVPNPLDDLPSGAAFLPDDWDNPGTDAQNRRAQSAMPGHVMTSADTASPADAPTVLDPLTLAFLKGAELLPEEVAPLGPAQMQALGALLRQALDGIVALEQASAHRAADLGLPRATQPRSAMATVFGAMQSARDTQVDLDGRLEDLARDSDALLQGAQDFATSAYDTLDPAAIEAQAGRNTIARLGPNRAAWTAYRALFAPTGGDDVPPPLSQTALLAAIAARYAGQRPNDETEPNTTIPGDDL